MVSENKYWGKRIKVLTLIKIVYIFYHYVKSKWILLAAKAEYKVISRLSSTICFLSVFYLQ